MTDDVTPSSHGLSAALRAQESVCPHCKQKRKPRKRRGGHVSPLIQSFLADPSSPEAQVYHAQKAAGLAAINTARSQSKLDQPRGLSAAEAPTSAEAVSTTWPANGVTPTPAEELEALIAIADGHLAANPDLLNEPVGTMLRNSIDAMIALDAERGRLSADLETTQRDCDMYHRLAYPDPGAQGGDEGSMPWKEIAAELDAERARLREALKRARDQFGAICLMIPDVPRYAETVREVADRGHTELDDAIRARWPDASTLRSPHD